MLAYVFEKYPLSFTFQLFIIFAVIYPWNLLFSLKIAYFLTVSTLFSLYKQNLQFINLKTRAVVKAKI